MKHQCEYKPLLYFIPCEGVPDRPDFSSIEIQGHITRVVEDFFRELPKFIEEKLIDNIRMGN